MAPAADNATLPSSTTAMAKPWTLVSAHHPPRFAVDLLGIDWRAVEAMNRGLGMGHRCSTSESGRQSRRAYRAQHVRHHRTLRLGGQRP